MISLSPQSRDTTASIIRTIQPEISDADYDLTSAPHRGAGSALSLPDNSGKPDTEGRGRALGEVRQGQALRSDAVAGKRFSDEDVEEFVTRVRRFLEAGAADAPDFTAKNKIDGLSVSLRV